jgi:xanthine dehydrogenase YagR molybdenum-binding subunit
MLEGRIVRSPLAHAELIDIDISLAATMPGVEAVITFAPPDGRIRFVGEGLAAVAAVDRRTARAGVNAVVATFAELETVVGIDAALAPGAPNLHGRGWAPQNSSETSPLPNLHRGNLRGPLSVGSIHRFAARRAVERARASPFLVEQRWELAAQVHAAFEPHVCVADWTDDGLTVYVSTQLVSGLVTKIAKRFDLDPATVTVVAEHVGGGFGAKQWLNEETIVAIQLSRASGRPVRVQFDRHEEMEVAGYRPGATVEISLAGSDDGALPAFTTTSHADGGVSAGQLVAFFQRFAYPGSPRALLDYDVLTNAPSGRAMRAPGGPQAFAALEGAVDEYAVRLGRNPIDLRRSWGGADDIVDRIYDWVESSPRWRDRERPRSGRFRRGTGVAFGCWIYAYDPDTVVEVSSGPTGFRVSTGTQDIGTGSRTVIAEAVADVLGVDVSMITVDIGTSGIWGPASAASRTTSSVHPAATAAARAAGLRLAQSAGEQLGFEGAEVVEGGLAHAGEFIPWDDLIERLDPVTVRAGRPSDTRRPLTPFTIEGTHFGWGLTRSAHVVEVEVDTRLGRIRPVAVDAVLAAGTIHVPALARSQAHGGVVQGLGYALTELRLLDPKTGLNITTTFDQYRIPGIAETPEVTVAFLEGGFEHSASRSAGLAEVAFAAVPAAVANAVSHAIGHRFTRLPIGPADVLEALR